jgi:choline kinase
MKSIILAAGIGSRLAPLTNEIPKSLVPVYGKPIIEHQIISYIEAGFQEFIIVVGYKSEKIKSFLRNFDKDKKFKFTIIENLNYLSTNNMYSLWLTEKYVKDEELIFISNADVVIEPDLVKHILKSDSENGIAYDKDTYNEESMKIVIENDRITSISKLIGKEQAAGNSIDFYKLGISGKQSLFK